MLVWPCTSRCNTEPISAGPLATTVSQDSSTQPGTDVDAPYVRPHSYMCLLLQDDTGALISAAAAAASQQQQEAAAGQQQQQAPNIPQMGPAFQGATAAAAWQEEEGSEETEGGLPEGVVLVRVLGCALLEFGG